jgi:hypothetical protein
MKQCPNCKCDYIDQAMTCSDCKIPLIIKKKDVEDEEGPKILQSGSEKLLIKVATETEADLIREYLASNGIQVLIKYEGIGGYMKLYMGTNVNESIEIYVLDSLYEQAKALILKSIEMTEVDEEYYVDDDDDNNYKYLNRYMMFRRLGQLLIFLVFVMPLLFFLLFQIVSLF